MSALVSIVIPVFNAAPYLEECLRSVSNQTYRSIEVIIINDGSTDKSVEIIETLSMKDSRFSLYNQENHGLGYTRNRGIDLSKGDFIFFLDSDDLLPTDAIEKLMAAIQKYNADYAVGEVLRLTEERKYPPKRHLDFKLYKKNKVTTLQESPELLQDSIACNKLWKAAFLKSNSLLFTEGKYYEDLNLTLKGAVLAKKIAVITDTVYYWRLRETDGIPSITQQQMRLKNTVDRLEALTRNREWLISEKASPKIVEENDLKCLLDVLRLHVPQYALITEDERSSWEFEIISFLNLIPSYIIDRLPSKEKLLYELLMDHNFQDLDLFSKMDTNTEKEKIVFQEEGNSFILKGKNKDYDVTSFIKPNLVVEEITLRDNTWLINGTLTIPKASSQTDGTFYIESRKIKQKTEIQVVTSKETVPSSLYPFETQRFSLRIKAADLPALEKDDVFDFYYFIKNEHVNTHRARIRLKNVSHEFMIQFGSKTATLYRTEHGNLSLNIQRNSLKRKIKQIAKKILSK